MELDLDAPAQEIVRLAAGVREDQLPDPSPGIDSDVAGLLGHLIGLSIAFRDGAAKVQGPTTSTPPGPVPLPEGWRTELPARLAELVAAWRVPDAWEGETTVGGVTMPAPQTLAFGNDELVLHGWDLAVATGQDYRPAEANLQACWALLEHIPDDPEARRGLFGPVVPVGDDAPLLDRVLGRAGRDPRSSAATTGHV